MVSNYVVIFGFFNFVICFLGGVVGDVFYNKVGYNFWYKKVWIIVCGVLIGVFLIVIGKVDLFEDNGMGIGIMVGFIFVMVIFYEVGNGVNFVFVFYVYFFVNGIVFGLIGVVGNFGGVVFVIIFCFMYGGIDFVMGFWVIGIMYIGLNLVVCWILLLFKG